MIRGIVIVFFVGIAGFLSLNIFNQLNDSLNEQQDVFQQLPKNPILILESSNLRKAWSEFSETNLLWKNIFSTPKFSSFELSIKRLDSTFGSSSELESIFNGNKTLISLHHVNKFPELFSVFQCTKKQFEYITRLSKREAVALDTIRNKMCSILKVSLQDSSFFYLSYERPFLMYATEPGLIQKVYSQSLSDSSLLDDEAFLRVRATASPSSNLHLYFKGDEVVKLISAYLKDDYALKIPNELTAVKWLELDVDASPNSILFSGISYNKKETYLPPLVNKYQDQILPDNLIYLKRLSLDSLSQLNQNTIFDSIAKSCNCSPLDQLKKIVGDQALSVTFKDDINEIHDAFLIEEKGHFNAYSILAGVIGIDSVPKNLNEWKIYKLENSDFIKLIGFDCPEKEYYLTFTDGSIVISSLKGLVHVYSDWIKEKELQNQSNYYRFSNKFLSSQVSSEYYFSGKKGFHTFSNNLKNNYVSTFSDFEQTFDFIDELAYEFSPSSKDFSHHTMAISVGRSKDEKSNVLWAIDLDSISSVPQLMRNHRTNTNEILVQDNSNTIHLIGASGRIKWSVELEGKIIGKVKQVDLFKNGKWQMVFNTNAKIHFLDINGKEVFGNPIKLDYKATNSIAVIDYDKDLNYRFIVSCADKKLYNFNAQGKKVGGWNLFKSNSQVKAEIQFFSINGKDYLFVNDVYSNAYFLNRKGKQRFSSSVQVYPRENIKPLVLKGPTIEKTTLIFIDSLALVHKTSLDGEDFSSSILDSNMLSSGSIILPAKFSESNVVEYVTANENTLALYGPELDLLLFEKFAFDINNNVSLVGKNHNYIVVYNEKLNQLHLYDSNLNGFPGFPVPGTLKTCVGDLNNDGLIELVTILGGKLITYTISNEAL